MNKRLFKTSLALAMLAGMHVQSAQAFVPGIYFTEALIDAASGYWFIEVTNLSGASQSVYFDDSSRGMVWQENLETGFNESVFDLDSTLSLGSLSNGQSAIITNACPNLTCKNNNGSEVFANLWPQLTSPSYKVIQTLNVAQFGVQVPEEINLYDDGENLLDRLRVTSASSGASVQPLPEDLGQDKYSDWAPSDVGDMFGSYQSSIAGVVTGQDVGSPGFYEITAVPEPETYAMMLAGLGLVGLVARKRKAANRIHA
ncbi:MAG TPA: FxDxF family PEP-CTERM protein [Thiobacillaceae bacterium]|nr:FxDxF family PEP-CTERM protein [Thiobacillaceae bacterium]